jgi:hypothetical protein
MKQWLHTWGINYATFKNVEFEVLVAVTVKSTPSSGINRRAAR